MVKETAVLTVCFVVFDMWRCLSYSWLDSTIYKVPNTHIFSNSRWILPYKHHGSIREYHNAYYIISIAIGPDVKTLWTPKAQT